VVLTREQPITISKKPYGKPQLIEYGSIAKLTQNGNGSLGDGGTMAGMFMMCL
jgi:hypothetical protein